MSFLLPKCRWDLINSCWEFQAQQRPTFSKIKTFLERTLQATKYGCETIESGHDCSGGNETNKPSEKKKSKGKSVTFAPQITGGFLRKCFAVPDDMFHRRLKSP